jgi:hypothetical protein
MRTADRAEAASGYHEGGHVPAIPPPRRDALRDFLASRRIGSEIYDPGLLHCDDEQQAVAAIAEFLS